VQNSIVLDFAKPLTKAEGLNSCVSQESSDLIAVQVSDPPTRADWLQKRIPKVFAVVVLAIGLVDLGSVLLPFTHELLIKRLSDVPGVVRGPAILTTFAGSLGLILIADGLARQKRRAHTVASALLALVVVDRIVLFQNDSIGFIRMFVPLVILMALLASRSLFEAKSPTNSFARTLFQLCVGGLIVWLVSVLVVWMRLRELGQTWSWLTYVKVGIPGLVGIITPITADDHIRSDVSYFALAGLGFGLLGEIFYVVLRSSKPEGLSGFQDPARLRALYLSIASIDSLSYFALRDDKLMCWAPDGRACIVYRVELGVALAGGDPIGDERSWPAAMHEFVTIAHSYGWLVGVIAASERGAAMWKECEGFAQIHMGDEAILNTKSFALAGRPMKNVRNAVTRAKRRGYSVEVHRLHDLPANDVAELVRLATDWRVGKHERGFSMALGHVDQVRDPEVLAVRAFVDGQLHGFMTFVPWGDSGASLDFMRRHPEATNGINEMLITEFVEWCTAHNIAQVSLNFTTFRKLLEQGSSDQRTALTRVGRLALLFASRFVQIETLHRFNSKFDPS